MYLQQVHTWHQSGGAGGQGPGQAAEKGCAKCHGRAAITPHNRTGWAAWRGSSSAEPGLMVLVGSKSNSRQQCALAAAKARCLLGCISRSATSRLKSATRGRRNSSPLFNTSYGCIWSTVSRFGPSKDQRAVGELEKAWWRPQWWSGAGIYEISGEHKTAGLVEPGEEQAKRGPCCHLPGVGGYNRFSSEEQKRCKRVTGKKIQIAARKTPTGYKENNAEQVLREALGFPFLEILQTGLEKTSTFV